MVGSMFFIRCLSLLSLELVPNCVHAVVVGINDNFSPHLNHAEDPVERRPSSYKADASKGKVFFLFLLGSDLAQEPAWDAFLKKGKKGVDYEAITHCTNRPACVQSSFLSKHEIISTVPSAWCELVGVMNSLLQAGLKKSTGPHKDFDKFVFVSGNAVPVKSFPEVWQSLIQTNANKSDFCVHPESSWPLLTENRALVKTHQWISLSRPHVVKSLYNPTVNLTYADMQDLDGCMDEYYHFAALYGLARTGPSESVRLLEGFNGHELHIGGARSTHVQGRCDTFAYWPVDRGQGFGTLYNEIRTNLHVMVDQEFERVVHPAMIFLEENASTTVDSANNELQTGLMELGSSQFTSSHEACEDTWEPDWATHPPAACAKWLNSATWGALKNGKTQEKACSGEWARVNCANTCGCGSGVPAQILQTGEEERVEVEVEDAQASQMRIKARTGVKGGLSSNAIEHLRSSPFLFIRKVKKDAMYREGSVMLPLATALERYIYDKVPA